MIPNPEATAIRGQNIVLCERFFADLIRKGKPVLRGTGVNLEGDDQKGFDIWNIWGR